ncbi:polysaccharide biosynthesis protein [Desulfofarcimen acetoxidans DSM 771]|uniref:Polysaccharide biosynthesis protein n=1 Tax=Desulfofarcimen acetoxidans (strain ATCC 49208 / DSM 771 / KCTC 5769 / VKM B-1644 / 5575) TaxID=485916 RepID=C8W2C5_DESAS|nr:oligosaccharide flippase family protein [Desulfofarcimen acetoxidans]ACV63609.1 polysaccharide biosynthesis protein [Desulfofarcimen acetoxidans DSM 771]
MSGLFITIKNLFYSGDSLSAKVVKNIIYSALLKFISILVSFCLIRVTYDYLRQEDIYGMWLTILSLLSWINFFDIGLGQSLRNRLAEAIALKDTDKGRDYVSTSYVIIGIFVITLLLIYFAITPYINWNKVFNSYVIDSYHLRKLMNLTVFFYLLSFFLSLIKSISFAFQDAVLPSLFGVISNTAFLIILFILYKCNMSGIIILAGVYSGISTAVLAIASIYLFFTKYRDIRPRFKSVKFNYAPDLLSLGIKFFIIQIAALIIFTTDNIVITQVLGPAYVTPYQIAFKLFSIFSMAASIILSPFWSAYTDAYSKGDNRWIIKILKKHMCLMIPLIIGVALTVLFSKQIITIWMGNKIQVPFLLILLIGIYTVMFVWNSIFAYIFNGIGKIRSSLIFSVFAAVINIPISIYLAKQIGVSGVILGNIVSLSFGAVLEPIKFYYIFYSKEKRRILDELFS